MKKLFFLLPLGILIIALGNPVFSEEPEQNTGTLIITYKTDNKGERLNRVRFWLIDKEGSKISLYPKSRAFVEDPKEPSRKVVINGVKAGNYAIKFLVPNADRYFQDLQPRDVVITQGEVVKIDQHIKPASLVQHIPLPSEPLKSIPAGKEVKENAGGQVKSISAEKATAEAATPSENRPVLAAPEKSSGSPLKEGFGKLIISYDSKQNPKDRPQENIRLRLIDSEGQATVHPIKGKDTEVPLTQGKMVVIPQTPAGIYKLEFFIEGSKEGPLLTLKDVKIEAGGAKSIHESLDLRPKVSSERASTPESAKGMPLEELSLSVSANIPTAIFRLENLQSKQAFEGEGRVHTFEKLPRGNYLLRFDSFDPFFVPPPPQPVTLDNQNQNIESTYQTLGKLKVRSNVSQGKVSLMRMDSAEHAAPIEIKEGTGIGYFSPGDYKAVFETAEIGKIPPDPIHLTIDSLQTNEIGAYFSEAKR